MAQGGAGLTLDSCLAYAYGHNLSVETARLNSELAASAFEGAKLNFLPSLSASASESLNLAGQGTRNGSYGINGSLTLFSGLANLRSYQQSRTSMEQADLRVTQSRNNIGSQVVSAYLTVVMNRERLVYQREVLATAEQQRAEGELKYEVGRLLESDYKLLDANYRSASNEIENTLITISNNLLALRSLLCWAEDEELDVLTDTAQLDSKAILLPTLDSVVAQSLRNMPDLAIGQTEVEIARRNVQISHSAFSPTLSLNAGMAYSDGSVLDASSQMVTSGGLNSSVTLGLNLPIFDRGQSITRLKQSRINLQQAELQLRQTELDLRKTIEGQWLETRRALNSFATTEALKEAYHASYEVYSVKYAAGAVTTVEFLQQQDRYLSSLNDYLQTKYTFLLNKKIMEIYTGKVF
ncbi:MAG: TolC family protein [Bacteroidales bacterium]|nr:TolC family protein [Bacteroidales bacterium]